MSLEVQTGEGGVVVRLHEHDLRGPALGATGEKLLTLAGPGKLILDFSGVEYLTSLAVGSLLALLKQVKAAGGSLVLENLSPRVYAIFAVTRLARLFDISPGKITA